MFGIDIDSFSALGVHGAMALIIFVQLVLMVKVIDLIKEHVVPLASNHFKHVEDAFAKLAEQSSGHQEITRQQIEVTRNQTAVLEAHGRLLRRLIKQETNDE